MDGRAQAAALKSKLAQTIKSLSKQHKQKPGLAIIRVGDDPASAIYVASKIKQSKDIGIRCFEYALPVSINQADILKTIQDINDDSEMHGVIVQLPLPQHLDKSAIIESIDPKKDVDGLHPLNFGRLAQGETNGLMPCTPLGVMHLLHSLTDTDPNFDLVGKHAVIIGASNLVGKPLSFLLKNAGCSFTMLHSRAQNMQSHAKTADILISATGQRDLVTKDWIKPGAVVIDVGISRDEDSQKIVGDINFDMALKRASYITPVPGGVGPMTVAYLLANTTKAFKKRFILAHIK